MMTLQQIQDGKRLPCWQSFCFALPRIIHLRQNFCCAYVNIHYLSLQWNPEWFDVLVLAYWLSWKLDFKRCIIIFYPRYIFPREVYKLMKMTERYDAQSVQSGTGRLSCSRTARCTSTETLWYEWLVSLVSPEIEEILLSRSSLLLLPSVDIFPRGLRKIEKKLTNRYDTQSA